MVLVNISSLLPVHSCQLEMVASLPLSLPTAKYLFRNFSLKMAPMEHIPIFEYLWHSSRSSQPCQICAHGISRLEWVFLAHSLVHQRKMPSLTQNLGVCWDQTLEVYLQQDEFGTCRKDYIKLVDNTPSTFGPVGSS